MAAEEEIRRLVAKAHKMHREDAELAAVCARKGAETLCLDVFAQRIQKQPGPLMLDELIRKLQQMRAIPDLVAIQLRTIQAFGNYYVHSQSDTASSDPASLTACMAALEVVTEWYYREICARPMPDELRAPKSTRPPVVAVPPEGKRLLSIETAAGLRDVLVTERDVFLWLGDDSLWAWSETGPHAIEAGLPLPLFTACAGRRELFVASADGVLGVYDGRWQLVAGDRPVLALALSDDGVLAADVAGRLRRLDPRGRTDVLVALEPMLVDVCATRDAAVVLDAAGGAWVIKLNAGRGSIGRVETSELGDRAWTLVSDPMETAVGIASVRRVARIDARTWTISRPTLPLADEIHQVVLVDELRLLALTDGGQLHAWDGQGWEPIVLPRRSTVASIAAAGRDRALVVSVEGDAFALRTGRAMTPLGDRVLAARARAGVIVLVREPSPGVLVVERTSAP